MTLAKPLRVFGASVYDKILYIFNGQLENTMEYSAPFHYHFGGHITWDNHNISDFYFGNYSSPEYIYYFGQSIVQIGEIVYGIFPTTKDLTNRALLKYSLVDHSYFDTNTYQAIRNSSQNSPCATFDSNLNVIYILGYYYTEFYNISSDTWTYFSDPNEMVWLSGCAMDIDSEYIFKFGGYNGNAITNTIEKYSVGTDSWSILSVILIQPLYILQCILYGSKIYCIGGYNNNIGYISGVHVLDPKTSNLDYGTYELNVKRADQRMLLFDNCLFVMGGFNGAILDSIEYLCLQ